MNKFKLNTLKGIPARELAKGLLPYLFSSSVKGFEIVGHGIAEDGEQIRLKFFPCSIVLSVVICSHEVHRRLVIHSKGDADFIFVHGLDRIRMVPCVNLGVTFELMVTLFARFQ